MKPATDPRSATATPDPAGLRAARGYAIRHGAATGLLGRVVSAGCGLATVPIAVGHLGTEAYGVWTTMASIAALLSLSDLGIGLGTRTLLARAFGGDDPEHLRATWDASLRWLTLIALVLVIVLSAAVAIPDWPRLLRVTSPLLAGQIRLGLWLVVWISCAGLPCALAPNLAVAVQRPWLANVAGAAGGMLTLAAVATAATCGAAWPIWVALITAVPVLVNFVIGVSLYRMLGWRPRWPRAGSDKLRQELQPLSLWMFVPQAGALFVQAAPPLVIAMLIGPAPVAAYNILQRLFGFGGQIHAMILSTLWPAYAEAEARGDFAWIRKGYRTSWLVTGGLFVPGLVAGTLLVPRIVAAWVGTPPVEIGWPLIGMLAMWQLLQLAGVPPAMLLNGLGRVRKVALYGTAGHAVSLVSMVILATRWGSAGVVFGMGMGYGFVCLPAIVLDARSRLQRLGIP